MEIKLKLLPHQKKFLNSKSRYTFMCIGRGGQKLVSFRRRAVRTVERP